MLLIVVTSEEMINDELEIINSLLAKGLQYLHVRKPSWSASGYKDYLSAIDAEYYSRIVIHANFELYSKLHLGGIHLNSHLRNDTFFQEEVRRIPHNVISASVHSWQEITDNSTPYRYIFISPVFDSISKAGYKAAIALDGARDIKTKLKEDNKNCPGIVGLGGVGEAQIKVLHDYGFDGAAILGAIWHANDPVSAFQIIQAAAARCR